MTGMADTSTKAPRKMAKLDMRRASLVDRAANRTQLGGDGEPVDGWMVMKADGTPVEGEMTEDAKTAIERAEKAEKDLADLNAYLEQAKKEADEAAVKQAADDATKDLDPVAKALADTTLPEPVRKALEAQQVELDAQKERTEKAEKIAETERDTRVAAEFVGKAATLTTHLPTTGEAFGPVLRSAAESMTADQFTALETVLRAANEQLEASRMFAELGSGGVPAALNGADAEIAAKAEEIRKADSSITPEAAMDRAYTENPDLVAKRRAEMQKG